MDLLMTSYNLTECGRVYVNLEKNHFFVLNCLFCKEEYCEWLDYIKHFQGDHLQIEEYCGNSGKWKIKTKYKEEIKDEYENQQECKDVNIQGDLDMFSQDSQEKEQTETNYEDYEIKSEFLDEELTKDLLESGIQEDSQKKKETNKDDILEEHLMETIMETMKDIKPSNSLDNSIFRLSTTDSYIMLKFIQLLRQHPCQWDHKHPDFTNKDRRNESSLELSQELKEHFNVNITPQVTRSRVLSLLRWFDQEYIRFLRCEEKDFKFICSRSEYFEKLLEFLPYKHLKPMTCDECFKHFKSEHLLMAHKHKHHNGQVPFQCRYCDRGFIHQSLHKMHENRHTKIQLWPCKMCSQQASTKADYIKHLATHSTKQPYKCDICGMAYKTTSNLNVHKKSHSLPEYECEICKKKFYEKYRYKRHTWLHEKEEKAWTSIDNFTCQICDRRFVSDKTLMKHKLVHIQENYDLDDVRDSQQKLKNELIVVYYCDYCSLEFINNEAYTTHMNLKHNIE